MIHRAKWGFATSAWVGRLNLPTGKGVAIGDALDRRWGHGTPPPGQRGSRNTIASNDVIERREGSGVHDGLARAGWGRYYRPRRRGDFLTNRQEHYRIFRLASAWAKVAFCDEVQAPWIFARQNWRPNNPLIFPRFGNNSSILLVVSPIPGNRTPCQKRGAGVVVSPFGHSLTARASNPLRLCVCVRR